MLLKLGYRFATSLSPKIAWKCAYLYGYKGMKAIHSYKKRLKRGELYPPFMLIALTNQCNLRCQGCWVEKDGQARIMEVDDLERIIQTGKENGSHYVTLLGGEPYMYPDLMEIFKRHSDCYFQVITNGMFFTDEHCRELKKLGNVTPLISIDGFEDQNDLRRGEGVFKSILKGLKVLKKNKLFFGIATTVTGKNMAEVMSDEYIQLFIDQGALYLWYYVYRPVGESSHPEYCMERDQILEMRRKLIQLRRRHPILLIDTYWTAEGEAVCPAASGLGFHVGPEGSIEPCPPLSFATDKVSDGALFETINNSKFLRGFQDFVTERTKGCVILEHPQELVEFFHQHNAVDYSTRDMFSEINAITPRTSHHIPGEEIPEDYWFYKFLKKQLFFGMGGYG